MFGIYHDPILGSWNSSINE